MECALAIRWNSERIDLKTRLTTSIELHLSLQLTALSQPGWLVHLWFYVTINGIFVITGLQLLFNRMSFFLRFVLRAVKVIDFK